MITTKTFGILLAMTDAQAFVFYKNVCMIPKTPKANAKAMSTDEHFFGRTTTFFQLFGRGSFEMLMPASAPVYITIKKV